MGPMAQDLYAAFGVGESDKMINSIDIDGVNLAAVRALSDRTLKQQEEIDSLKKQNAELLARLEKLEAGVKQPRQ
jgi:hypothetical protein